MATLIDIDPARQLVSAEHDLAAEFASVAPDEIHSMMVNETRRYNGATVRDYVSILVAKAVRHVLLTRGPSLRLAGRTPSQ